MPSHTLLSKALILFLFDKSKKFHGNTASTFSRSSVANVSGFKNMLNTCFLVSWYIQLFLTTQCCTTIIKELTLLVQVFWSLQKRKTHYCVIEYWRDQYVCSGTKGKLLQNFPEFFNPLITASRWINACEILPQQPHVSKSDLLSMVYYKNFQSAIIFMYLTI